MSERTPGNEGTPSPEPQEQERPNPRIYVASLADYNAGRLHGRWIDAAREVDELQADIQAMLEASPENRLCVWCGEQADQHPKVDHRGVHGIVPGKAEEWAIHDYEGFGRVRLSEYESMETVSVLAKGIAEHGRPFAAWASIVDSLNAEELAKFQDCYWGTWNTVEDYAEEMFEDMGWDSELDKLDERIRDYVSMDMESFAHDLQSSGDITVAEDDGEVHIFDGNS